MKGGAVINRVRSGRREETMMSNGKHSFLRNRSSLDNSIGTVLLHRIMKITPSDFLQ